MSKDCKPGCRNICKTQYENRPLAPLKTAENMRDGLMKCLNCSVWIKIKQSTKSCPCCRSKLRRVGRGKYKVEKKTVD